uniref:C-type lectin domain-containing protein n=1 Tax=Taenia asiatica TaxID=60517 RepID=A0A0R3WGG9_TAEAS
LILPLFHLLIFLLRQLCPRERGCFGGPAACLPTSLATSPFPPFGENLYMVVHTIRGGRFNWWQNCLVLFSKSGTLWWEWRSDAQENEEGCALKWGKVSHRMTAVCQPCGQDFRVACAAATEAWDLSNEVVQWEQRRMRDAQVLQMQSEQMWCSGRRFEDSSVCLLKGDTMPEEVSQWEIMKM